MCKKVSTFQNSLGGHQWKMFEEPVQQDFLTSTLLIFGANGSFFVESNPVHCRMFTSLPGISPPFASNNSSSPVVMTKNNPRHCLISAGGKAWPWLKTTAVKQSQGPSIRWLDVLQELLYTWVECSCYTHRRLEPEGGFKSQLSHG